VNPRLRKAVAGVAVLLFLALWILGALKIAGYLPQTWWAKGLFFLVAGVGWGVPLFPLIAWAERGRWRKG
jgi:hypothetical protein